MGRIGAATQLVTELSFDRLSAIKTEALCGYSFDILSPGAEQQDQEQIRSLTHKFMSASGRPSFRMPSFPSASEHEDIVYKLQAHSQIYLSLQQLVRLIAFFGEWRDAEEELLE
jgi:nuclear pore complex protein Nup107